MNWLAFFFALELGVVPHAGVLMYEPDERSVIEGAFYTELEAEVLIFNTLFAGGGVRTYVTTSGDDYTFAPNATVYDFGAGLRFRDTIELGFRYRCFHPTFPYLPILMQELKGMEGSYNEIYIRIQGSTKR